MRKYITEFIGTFFLVFVIGRVVLGGKGDFAPLAIGSTLMVMVYAGGHISGAHYNPAVTLAVLLRGKISAAEAILYMIAQILGAIAASFLVIGFMRDQIPDQVAELASAPRAVAAELVGTFALAYVVLNVATAKDNSGNSFYGLAIGFTVSVMASALGGVSGGAFNPAVAIGISIMHLAAWSSIWVFLVGCFGGAAIAAGVFKFCNPDDK
jgi:aquaporin Z